MHALLTLVTVFGFSAFASEPVCPKSLGTTDDFVLTDAHRERLVAKIIENAGDPTTKYWHGVNDGNVGLHVYEIPHARTERFFAIATNMFGGKHLRAISADYNPRNAVVFGVLETDDEPVISIVILPKDPATAVMRGKLKLNPVDSSDSEEMRKLVPAAWNKDGDFHDHHLLWEMLHDAKEVRLPGRIERPIGPPWTIEAYR